jgi:hypothetical protein
LSLILEGAGGTARFDFRVQLQARRSEARIWFFRNSSPLPPGGADCRTSAR